MIDNTHQLALFTWKILFAAGDPGFLPRLLYQCSLTVRAMPSILFWHLRGHGGWSRSLIDAFRARGRVLLSM